MRVCVCVHIHFIPWYRCSLVGIFNCKALQGVVALPAFPRLSAELRELFINSG